jgi:hypothetical protein
VTTIPHFVPFTVTLTVYDAYQNVALGYMGTVHFTSSDSSATLPADYTFIPGDQGSHTFIIKLRTLGSQSVTVTDSGNGSITDSVTVLVTGPSKTPVLLHSSSRPTSTPPMPTPPLPAPHQYDDHADVLTEKPSSHANGRHGAFTGRVPSELLDPLSAELSIVGEADQ